METSAARTARPGPTHPPPGTPPHDDAHTGGVPRVVDGRRRTVLLVLAAVAVLSAAALVLGLLSWQPDRPEQARALTGDERDRLAAMRVTNYRDLRAGVRVTAGSGAARTELVGWVDWSRPLLYLDVGGPGAGGERGLLQATPAIVLLRPDPAAVPTPAPPPLVPPADRWRLHDPASGQGLAAVLDLIFRLAADRPDPAADAARRVGGATVGAAPVDILEAPPPGPGTPPDARPRYWLDRDARLHRLETRLAGLGPVTVQLNRADRPALRPVDALGGRAGQPRALTAPERGRLDRLPARLRARGGAAVTLTAPVGTATNLRGSGWVSWTGRAAYVAVADLGVPERRTLLRLDGSGVSRAEVPAATVPGGVESPGRPPLPPPARGWRADAGHAGELGLLLDAALRAARSPDGRDAARRVRGDTTAGKAVDVIELRTPRGPLRYWIDRSGALRRLELRTRVGAWAQLDLTPATVPRLAPARGR